MPTTVRGWFILVGGGVLALAAVIPLFGYLYSEFGPSEGLSFDSVNFNIGFSWYYNLLLVATLVAFAVITRHAWLHDGNQKILLGVVGLGLLLGLWGGPEAVVPMKDWDINLPSLPSISLPGGEWWFNAFLIVAAITAMVINAKHKKEKFFIWLFIALFVVWIAGGANVLTQVRDVNKEAITSSISKTQSVQASVVEEKPIRQLQQQGPEVTGTAMENVSSSDTGNVTEGRESLQVGVNTESAREAIAEVGQLVTKSKDGLADNPEIFIGLLLVLAGILLFVFGSATVRVAVAGVIVLACGATLWLGVDGVSAIRDNSTSELINGSASEPAPSLSSREQKRAETLDPAGVFQPGNLVNKTSFMVPSNGVPYDINMGTCVLFNPKGLVIEFPPEGRHRSSTAVVKPPVGTERIMVTKYTVRIHDPMCKKS